MFDQDTPGTRSAAKGHRVLQSADKPGEVFVMVEFDTTEQAREGREKLLASGVLDRFKDRSEPKILEQAEQVDY